MTGIWDGVFGISDGVFGIWDVVFGVWDVVFCNRDGVFGSFCEKTLVIGILEEVIGC